MPAPVVPCQEHLRHAYGKAVVKDALKVIVYDAVIRDIKESVLVFGLHGLEEIGRRHLIRVTNDNWAQESGLMSTQGQSFRMRSPICVNRVLIDTPLPLDLIACWRIPRADDTFASLLKSGRFFAILK